MIINTQQVTGLDERAIDVESLSHPVHEALVEPFIYLKERAAEAGFDLAIASAYRSFERQRLIWNGKMAGQRPVYDAQGELLDVQLLSPWQQVEAILRWSALPGASRHHWGADLDVYDRAAVDEAYQIQLSPSEVYDNGPFRPFHDWLDQQLAAEPELGFFRPYEKDRGGVAPERWHLSYAPVAAHYQRAFTEQALVDCLQDRDVTGSKIIMQHLDLIIARFVDVPQALYPQQYQPLLADRGD